MPFLPHDASAGDTAGAAGTTGNPGSAGSGSGAAGRGGAAGTGVGGVAGGDAGTGGAISGAAGDAAGAGGTGSGVAGSGDAGSGVAGAGAAGTGGSSNPGDAGSSGSSGSSGLAGSGGLGGLGGLGGSAGAGGIAGTGVGGTVGGRGGMGGRGGTGGVVTPCTALSCSDGCCKDSTTCIRMRSATQCGAQGAACSPCGGCQICSAMGQCRIDPASRWKIVGVSAQIDSSFRDRASGEIGGTAPDPFCEYENPAGQVTTSTAGVTDTLTDTYKPVWNQEITPPGMTVAASTLMANSPTWQIWVGDDDGCSGPGGCLGDVVCTIRQTITETQLRAGQLVVNNRQSCDQVTIGLICQPLFP